MKVVIFAGGYGTRISEITNVIPKPLIEIGEMPIIWHIMKIYSYYGFNEFIVCCGYKGYLIKQFFNNLSFYDSDITIDLKKNGFKKISKSFDNWKIHLEETFSNIQKTLQAFCFDFKQLFKKTSSRLFNCALNI